MNTVDYSKSFLCPTEIVLSENRLKIVGLGAQIEFCGKILSLNAQGTLKTSLKVNGQTIEPRCLAESDCKIEDYQYFDGQWSGADEIETAETNCSGIAAFLRKGKVSFFLSLDFPYCKIDRDGARVTIGCDPADRVKAGEIYCPHTLTVGACMLTGVKVGKFDRAEIEAFSEYILQRMPEKFKGDRPIYSATSITNRMTDVRDGRVFYSMYDNPTLTLDADTLKEEVKLCGELGIEYYQLFEGYFDWEEDGSSERNLKEIMKVGKEAGVRIGDYMTTLELNCWHYNYHSRRVRDESLLAMDEGGNRYYLCYGNDKTVEMLENTIIPSILRNGEEMICLDGNAVVPCFDASHGHNPGSYYGLIRGLVNFMKKLNAVSPYFMVWTNAGNWIEFMPKLLWYNPNVYLTDPHPREYSSAVNLLKYYGDCRREQMVSVHNKYFVPYTAFTNCEYYTFRHSRVNDMAFFEYSFLQGLAVTPNICFGELRTFLERIPVKFYQYARGFIKKWLAFIRENIDAWKYVYQVGDSPNPGANEIYAHVNKDHGFICLVNQDACRHTAKFRLNESVGLRRNQNAKYLLSEIYPQEAPLFGQRLSGAEPDDEIILEVPAYSVRIIRIEPYTALEGDVRVYGIGGKLKREGDALTLSVSSESGTRVPIAVSCENDGIREVAANTVKTVPKYYFPASVTDVKSGKNAVRFTLNTPREYFNREISQWRVGGGATEYFLDQQNSDFCGGYIHNFYKENQKVDIVVSLTEGAKEKADSAIDVYFAQPEKKTAPPVRRADEYSAKLDIPFIEYPNLACEIGYDEVLELVFKNSKMVKSVKAELDGKEVPVQEFYYASGSMKAFYIELVGRVASGTQPELKLKVEWDDEFIQTRREEQESKAGAQVIS